MKREVKEHLDLAEELRKENVKPKKRQLILKNVKERLEKEKTMKLSIREGSFASVMFGLGDYYLVPYALALNLNNFQIGLLRSFSGLVPPITGLYGSKLMEKTSRKRILVKYIALQAFMWIPILLLSLLFWKGIITLTIPYILIAFYTLYAVFGAIARPSWVSLMGDIVPKNIRGKYFGKRSRITGIVALICTVSAAFFLDFFKTKGFILLGFSILFILASIARFISANYFRKHHQTKFKLDKKYYFSFFNFIAGIKKYNFTRFSYFVAVMHFAVMIASPFFAVYMLTELNFSYVTFMIVYLSSSLASLLMMPVWGKFSDKYGRKETLLLSCIFFSIMPILWFVSSSPYYLILPMAIAGVGWAGFNLSSLNFLYDSVSQERRGLCSAYLNILIGIGIFLGAGLGGLILQKILPLFNFGINHFFVVFLLSSFLRTITAVIFLPHIKEERRVKKFHPITSFRKLEHHAMHELIDGIHKIEGKKD